jgi:short-subunit dehydrogenase
LGSKYQVEVLPIAHDLAAANGGATLADRLRDAGRAIDVLINNAGVGRFGDFGDADLAGDVAMIQLNITSLVELTKRCLPHMRAARAGRIMHVASTAAFLPGPHMAIYYATKAFVLSFSEALADELRDTAVTVTALCPGPTATEFQRRAGASSSKLFKGAIMDARTVAEAGYRGMMRGDTVVIPGARNKIVPWAPRLFPRRFVTTMSRKASEQRTPLGTREG